MLHERWVLHRPWMVDSHCVPLYWRLAIRQRVTKSVDCFSHMISSNEVGKAIVFFQMLRY